MNRADKFAKLVELGINLVLHAEHARNGRDYVGILADAMCIPEETIPEDFEGAARDFLTWKFAPASAFTSMEPEWHEAWRQGEEGWNPT